ncbi:hypothetical protein BDN70DRAFT_869926 [Pholiota conissans]|uniref:Exocyst complex component EXO84 n=1 Tax=Pholiota conissans TaxID=109636 RepID=A0A9P5ZFB7_9AGAR|nr:hypothetical protein BDN70DRAFT_869926 [Pholiota conissans]
MEVSLRSRPSQAPRKNQQRSPAKLAKPGAGVTPRDRGKNRIDDKIKKRMSTRYADISSPTQLSGVPPMPSFVGLIPAGERAAIAGREGEEDLRDRTSARDDAKAATDDRKLLSADDFDPAAYLKLKLANSTEAELKLLQSSLRNAIDDTSSELQRSVFKNYAEFVLISKEISVLENEMLELKDLLSDYKSMPSTLHIPDPTSTSSSLMSTYKRSSVADLRVLYFNQMQALHASIEGATKFVPTTPGRHVVGEVENVFSLNAATYRIVGKVKFVVLDDAVLVAKRRRRNANGDASGSTVNEGKLVAEKCWPLSEMLVLDTKDSPSMTNVFKIRHGKETHVYRTESPADKKGLLAQFRQVAEELSQKRRKEREGEHERRKSMWQGTGGISIPGRNSPIPPMPEWMAELARKGGDIPGVAVDAKEKAERDTRWVGEWSDDLTVAIALKEWSKAVDLVEKGQAKVAVMPPLAAKLPHLTSQLITSLLASLALPSVRKSTVVTNIGLLNRLKAGAAARSTFLEMRAQVIHSLTRKIRFEGHIGTFIGELSVVYFTAIKHSADWYLASFKENEVASSFITWTKERIEGYAEIFRKQVYSKDVDRSVVNEAIAITQQQSKKLLQEYGLDFRYLLDDILLEHPKEQSKFSSTFSFREHRLSKAGPSSTSDLAKQIEQSSMSLPQAPPIPTILPAPPPIAPRRTLPTPQVSQKSSSPLPPPIGNNDSLYPPSEGMRSPGIISPGAANSSYSNMRYDANNSVAPLLSARQNMARSKTPVSSASTPMSAPPPSVPVTAPIPRPPVSATTYRTRDRSGSIKDREGSEGYFERPVRSARASPVPRSPAVPLPPRSANRPGSSMGGRTPVAVPQHEGMI